MLLEIPPGALTYELLNSIVWFDNDGILYSKPKNSEYIQQTRENISSEIKRFKEIIGDKKVKLIVHAHPGAKPIAKQERNYIAEQYAGVIDALAILNASPIVKMITSIFFSFNPPPYPTKMFSNPASAKEWLMEIGKKTPSSFLKFVA